MAIYAFLIFQYGRESVLERAEQLFITALERRDNVEEKRKRKDQEAKGHVNIKCSQGKRGHFDGGFQQVERQNPSHEED